MALLNTPHPSGKLARWGLTLQDVDIVIRYRPGKNNTGADALSHLPVDQDDDVDPPSLPTEQIIKNLGDGELLVAATVVEEDAKSGERSSGKHNENESCQQTEEENNGNVSIRDRQ